MKQLVVLACMIFFSVGAVFSQQVNNHCEYQNSKEKSLLTLRPFKYTSQDKIRVELKPHEQFKEVVVPLYRDSKYRFVFNSEGIPGEVKVWIYHEPKTENNREAIFKKSVEEGEIKFETKDMEGLAYHRRYEKLYVDFVFPPTQSKSLDVVERGCMVMVAGYKVKTYNPSDQEDESGGGFLNSLFGGNGDEEE